MPFIDIDFRSIRHSKEKREIVMRELLKGIFMSPWRKRFLKQDIETLTTKRKLIHSTAF